MPTRGLGTVSAPPSRLAFHRTAVPMHTRDHATSRAPRRVATRTLVLAVALFVGAGLVGCGDGPTEVPGPTFEVYGIDGTWHWVTALDVRTGTVHTPASAGFDASLEFRSDEPRAGAFTYTRAGRPPVSGRYGIGSEDVPGNEFIVLEPGIDFLARNAWIGVGRDSLYLGGVMEMGYNSKFARAP